MSKSAKTATTIPEENKKHGKKKKTSKEEIEKEQDQDYNPFETSEEESEEEEETGSGTESSDEGSSIDEEEISKPAKTVTLAETVMDQKKDQGKKRKRKEVDVKSVEVKTKKKRLKKTEKRKMEMDEKNEEKFEEKNIENNTEVVDEKKEKNGRRTKKTGPFGGFVEKFSRKNVDFVLYNESPDKIIPKKLAVSTGINVLSRMLEAKGDSKNLNYDYAALTIQREIKQTGNAYDFNLPLNIIPGLIASLMIIAKCNKVYFGRTLEDIERECKEMVESYFAKQ